MEERSPCLKSPPPHPVTASCLITNISMVLYCLGIVRLLGRVQLFVTPLTSAHQASLPFTVSQSLLKLMSVELVMPSSHLILCRPLLLLPSVFPSSLPFASGGQSIGVLASASVLPVNIQGWFPLGCTGWLSLLSEGLSRVFPSTTVQKHGTHHYLNYIVYLPI